MSRRKDNVQAEEMGTYEHCRTPCATVVDGERVASKSFSVEYIQLL